MDTQSSRGKHEGVTQCLSIIAECIQFNDEPVPGMVQCACIIECRDVIDVAMCLLAIWDVFLLFGDCSTAVFVLHSRNFAVFKFFSSIIALCTPVHSRWMLMRGIWISGLLCSRFVHKKGKAVSFPGKCTRFPGNVCNSLEMYAIPWKCMRFPGNVCDFLENIQCSQ